MSIVNSEEGDNLRSAGSWALATIIAVLSITGFEARAKKKLKIRVNETSPRFPTKYGIRVARIKVFWYEMSYKTDER